MKTTGQNVLPNTRIKLTGKHNAECSRTIICKICFFLSAKWLEPKEWIKNNFDQKELVRQRNIFSNFMRNYSFALLLVMRFVLLILLLFLVILYLVLLYVVIWYEYRHVNSFQKRSVIENIREVKNYKVNKSTMKIFIRMKCNAPHTTSSKELM